MGCSACPARRVVGEWGQAGSLGAEGVGGTVLREQLSMAHCGAGKPLLSTPINGQRGETESVFIKFACHARPGPQTEKGLWQTGEMGWKAGRRPKEGGRACCGMLLREGTQAGEDVPPGCCLLPPLLQPWSYGGSPRDAADCANADRRGSCAALRSPRCLGKCR